jgi:hypothetical protein
MICHNVGMEITKHNLPFDDHNSLKITELPPDERDALERGLADIREGRVYRRELRSNTVDMSIRERIRSSSAYHFFIWKIWWPIKSRFLTPDE